MPLGRLGGSPAKPGPEPCGASSGTPSCAACSTSNLITGSILASTSSSSRKAASGSGEPGDPGDGLEYVTHGAEQAKRKLGRRPRGNHDLDGPGHPHEKFAHHIEGTLRFEMVDLIQEQDSSRGDNRTSVIFCTGRFDTARPSVITRLIAEAYVFGRAR